MNQPMISWSHNQLIEHIKKLEAQLASAKEVIKYYGDPEQWMEKTAESWKKTNPSRHGDKEIIKNYKHPNSEWTGTISVGGKKARLWLKENGEA
jgi:hypothetical protein